MSAPLALPPAASLRAVLFDIDGTLTDSDPLHFEVFKALFKEVGVPSVGINQGDEIDMHFFHKHISGRTNPQIFGELFPEWDPQKILEESDAKEARFRALAASVLTPVAGLLTLTKWIKECGLKVAAVTNAPRENAEMMMAAIGLGEYFDTVVIGTECARAKPHPDPYQEALRHFGVDPHEAIAFEDSPTGLSAAVAAGVATVGVLTSQSSSTMETAGASLTIHDYEAKDLWAYLNNRKSS